MVTICQSLSIFSPWKSLLLQPSPAQVSIFPAPPPPQFYLNCVTHQGAKLCQSPFRTGPPVHQPMGDYLNPHTSLPLGCYSSTCLGPPQPPCRTTKLNWYVTYSPETHSHTQWVALMSPGSTSSKDYGFPLRKGAKPRGGNTFSSSTPPSLKSRTKSSKWIDAEITEPSKLLMSLKKKKTKKKNC